MKITVSGFEKIGQWADGVSKAYETATLKALNFTAYDMRDVLKAETTKDFDAPTPYTQRGFYVKPAKSLADPVAEIGVPDNVTRGVPQVRFMAPEVYGGARSMKSHEKKLGAYTGPSRFAPRDRYGNVPGGFYKKVLSQLNLSSDAFQNATNSPRSRKKRAVESFYIAGNVLLSTKGGVSRPMLFLLKQAPRYQPRFSFYETARDAYGTLFKEKFIAQFNKLRA